MFSRTVIGKWVTKECLTSRAARILFAASAVTIIAATALYFDSAVTFEREGLVSQASYAVVGILIPAGVFLLWDGMRQYWLRCDPSPEAIHKRYFWIMLFGLWYGALIYYGLVYLPNTTRDLHRADRKRAL